MLVEYAKPFKLPAKEQILKFRYTTYYGEDHPAGAKVVMTVSANDLPLSEEQKHKFILVAGPRYDAKTSIIKFSHEEFKSPLQNKRYLLELYNKLIETSKDSSDTFSDIPLRPVEKKNRKKMEHRVPSSWLPGLQREKQQLKLETSSQTLRDMETYEERVTRLEEEAEQAVPVRSL